MTEGKAIVKPCEAIQGLEYVYIAEPLKSSERLLRASRQGKGDLMRFAARKGHQKALERIEDNSRTIKQRDGTDKGYYNNKH